MALLNELGITFPAGSTPDASVLRDYKVLGTPATYFFTSDGKVIQQWNGLLSGDQLEEYVERLIEA